MGLLEGKIVEHDEPIGSRSNKSLLFEMADLLTAMMLARGSLCWNQSIASFMQARNFTTRGAPLSATFIQKGSNVRD